MLPPSFHDQVDRDVALTDRGERVAALDRAPRPGEILYRDLDRPAQVRIPPHFCLIGPVSPSFLAIQRGAYSRDLPAPLAARCGDLRVVGHGVLLLDQRTRLISPDHFVHLPRDDPDFLTKFREHLGAQFVYDSDGHPRIDLASLAERSLKGQVLVLAQPGYMVFGHWLCEILPRLILARRFGLAGGRFLLPSPFPPSLMPWLAAYGVLPEQIVWLEAGKEIVRLEDGIICSRLNFDSAYAPLANSVFGEIRQQLVATPPARPSRRIFLSRRSWKLQTRQLANHEQLAGILARQGFEEIHPETLSPADVARLMSEASHVVAEDGSACLLMIYAAPSARLLVLQPNNRLNPLHHTIAQALNQRVGIVMGAAMSATADGSIGYRIEPADLEEGLAALLQTRSSDNVARSWWKSRSRRPGRATGLPEQPAHPEMPACYDRFTWMPDKARRTPLSGPAADGEILAQEYAPRCSVSPRQPFCVLGQEVATQAVETSWTLEPCLAYRASNVSVLGMGLLRDAAGQILLRNDSRYCAIPAEAGRARFLRTWLGALCPDQAAPLPDLDSLTLEQRRVEGTTLLLSQPGQRIFGHSLLELLPRLWAARRLGLVFDQVLLATHLPPGIEQALAWFGLEPRQRIHYAPDRQRAQCSDLLILDSLFDFHAFHPQAADFYDEVARDAFAASGPGGPQRLYLSRRLWQKEGRQLANRDELAPLLADAGFVEVHPETLPLREQIALMAGARLIVADEGSAAHLPVFAPAGTGLLLLAPEGRRNPRHGAVAQLRDLSYGWVMGEVMDNPAGGEADYRIAPERLAEGLRLLCA